MKPLDSQGFTLPFCPRKLVILADMVEFVFGKFANVKFGVELTYRRYSGLAASTDQKGQLTKKEKKDALATLLETQPICTKIGMKRSIGAIEHCRTLLTVHSGDRYYQEMATVFHAIWTAMTEEIREFRFAFIEPKNAVFFEKDGLFGDKVSTAFPSAVPEIKAAGNCLAADLGTAAVFHSMRAVEHGLRAFARHLRARTSNPIEFEDWGRIIKATQDKIDTLPPGRNKRKIEALEFYRSAMIEFNTLKDVWRNAVMHTRGNYNPDEAIGVFNRARDLMQNLSKRVSEK